MLVKTSNFWTYHIVGTDLTYIFNVKTTMLQIRSEIMRQVIDQFKVPFNDINDFQKDMHFYLKNAVIMNRGNN